MEGKLEDGLKFEQGTTDLKGDTHEIAQTVQVHQFKAPDPNSKRQAKRKVRNEIWAQLKAKKKEMKKQKKKEQKQMKQEKEIAQAKTKDIDSQSMDLKEFPQEEEKKAEIQHTEVKLTGKQKKKLYKDGVEKGQTIIIDCSFQDLLTQKELNSVCIQLGYCQATNRKFPVPVKLTVTSFRDKVKEKMTRFGALQWGVVLLEKHYTEYFKLDDLIYLTGDAEEEIEEIDPTKVYILGGLVDHGRMKNGTYNQAVREGIKARRLPLGKYIKLANSTILSINHVFEVMVRLANGHSMQKALVESIPTRKVQEYLEKSEQTEGASEKKKDIGTSVEKIEVKEDSSEKVDMSKKL